jgi:DNA-binding response OmpR family regulator
MQKILIVDDTPANVKSLLNALKNPDYKLFVATNGTNALEMIASNPPDLILLDIVMPIMDGYEVCKKLKADKATKNIPVIFITARDDNEDEELGFEMGAVDYITKPINLSTVQARVKTHLKLKQAYEELKQKNIALKESSRLRENVERIIHHDLKTPLNAVIGYSTLLKEERRLKPEERKMLEKIEDSGYQMLELINRSLDIYKMETGTYHYNIDFVDILNVLNKVVADTKNLSSRKNLSLDILTDAIPDKLIVQGEELLCYSLFANLIKNAIEASPKSGQITISLSEKDTTIISIHNQGTVPKEIRDKFFEKYITAGKPEGTGLGTYSAKLMAETQGGSIHVETSEETGTTVTVLLIKKE